LDGERRATHEEDTMRFEPKHYRITDRNRVTKLLLQKEIREWATGDDFEDIILNGYRGLNDLDEEELIEELFSTGLLIEASSRGWVEIRTVQAEPSTR
jgi:hypothetical protein